MRNRRGFVLIAVLWVVFFLSLIAWGLGRRSSMEASLITTYEGKMRSYAAARGGLEYALGLLEKATTQEDTLYSTGITYAPDQTPKAVFGKIEVSEGTYASIQSSPAGYPVDDETVYGFRDEEGKININALNSENYIILSEFLKIKGVPEGRADQLARAVVNYRLPGLTSRGEGWLSKGNQSMDEQLKPKMKPYEHLRELLDVPGMDLALYNKISGQLTVYGGFANGLWVNVKTASDEVISAIALAAKRQNARIYVDDVINAAKNIRDGQDSMPFTNDDGIESIPADIEGWPPSLRQGISNHLNVKVIGVDGPTGARTTIEAVIARRLSTNEPNRIVGYSCD